MTSSCSQITVINWRLSRRLIASLPPSLPTQGASGDGMFIISVSELLEIAVWIIQNEKIINSISAKKIVSELLERLNFWNRYGRLQYINNILYLLLKMNIRTLLRVGDLHHASLIRGFLHRYDIAVVCKGNRSKQLSVVTDVKNNCWDWSQSV